MEKNKITTELSQLFDQLQKKFAASSEVSATEIEQLILQLYQVQEKLRDLKYAMFKPVEVKPAPVVRVPEAPQEPTPIKKEIKMEVKQPEVVAPKEVKAVHETLASSPVVEVNTVAQKKAFSLDLNDRIYIQRELFNNDSEAMREFIEKLVTHSTLDQKMTFFSSQQWNEEAEPVKRFIHIIEKSFA